MGIADMLLKTALEWHAPSETGGPETKKTKAVKILKLYYEALNRKEVTEKQCQDKVQSFVDSKLFQELKKEDSKKAILFVKNALREFATQREPPINWSVIFFFVGLLILVTLLCLYFIE